MEKYKLGKIYTAENKDEAREFIGKEGFFSDFYNQIWDEKVIGTSRYNYKRVLEHIYDGNDGNYPFGYLVGQNGSSKEAAFQFFRPILEERQMRMTWEEILEWLARGNGFIFIPSDYYDEPHWDVYIYIDATDETLDKEVSEDIRIRHFGTDEIIVPTRDIFIRDCRRYDDARGSL